MKDRIRVAGIVATQPRSMTTSTGVTLSSFRIASPQGRLNKETGEWVDKPTNWYTVSAHNELATKMIETLSKGDRVRIHGNLILRYSEAAGHIYPEIEAERFLKTGIHPNQELVE